MGMSSVQRYWCEGAETGPVLPDPSPSHRYAAGPSLSLKGRGGWSLTTGRVTGEAALIPSPLEGEGGAQADRLGRVRGPHGTAAPGEAAPC
ncbi:MAG: hypothetical protein RLY86_730 [Pseudomonadota bacterium]|jgi:hypothetical protein